MNTNDGMKNPDDILDKAFSKAEKVLENYHADFSLDETGVIISVGKGIAKVKGLPGVKFDELIRFPNNKLGIAFDLEPDYVSVVLLARNEEIQAGMEVLRTGKIVEVPVGESLLGRVVDPLGNPLDGEPPVQPATYYPIERPAAAIMDRAPVTVPLQTGILSIDAFIPIGRGQRELIIGDRQVGKTALAIDTIINQRGKGVICVYCSIGQQSSSVAKIISDLKKYNAMDYTFIVAVSGDDPPGMNFIAPYSATSMAEYFMEKGKDVLIVYDDLIKHARSYREISLLQRRPPAREAFPGDIFYIHSRLLERATHMVPEKGGGSLTALPIVETEAQNIAAYIPTNLVSITDGQIYLTQKLFQEGILPACDVGKSVSRVGGNAQLPAYRDVAGALRLSYSQFEELEIFERFSTRMDEETRKILERGRRIREILKQPRYDPIQVNEQIILLKALTAGLLDGIDLKNIKEAEKIIRKSSSEELFEISGKIIKGEVLSSDDKLLITNQLRNLLTYAGRV